ncbi:hypothetical protein D7X30_05030 [Corallococcus sp. AB011P]|uniref:hypothetical protein n=1 Tax=Corallococcus sp. AB011P TaxID=2316735 RepID=UPI000EA0BCC9|nr:hypothetical protein [Corallococcus sp. AB011P]RKG62646.1 hypothetical protein D7X30_05030 [Corallococcus sp. AB011P]
MNFRLPSNAGYDTLEGAILRPVRINDEPCLLLELRTTGTYFSRDRSPAGKVVEDYAFRLPQVVVLRDRMEDLLDHLRHWQVTQEDFGVDLEPEGHEATCTMEVGMREGMHCGPYKPAFTLYYSSVKTRVEVTFVVDPSCLLEWAETMERALELASPARRRPPISSR